MTSALEDMGYDEPAYDEPPEGWGPTQQARLEWLEREHADIQRMLGWVLADCDAQRPHHHIAAYVARFVEPF